MTSSDARQSRSGSFIKLLVFLLPTVLLPRVWIARPIMAFGLGASLGIVMAYLLPPRSRVWKLVVSFILLALVLVIDMKMGVRI